MAARSIELKFISDPGIRRCEKGVNTVVSVAYTMKGKRKAPVGMQQVRDAFILTGYPFVSLELGQQCWLNAVRQLSLSPL